VVVDSSVVLLELSLSVVSVDRVAVLVLILVPVPRVVGSDSVEASSVISTLMLPSSTPVFPLAVILTVAALPPQPY
jgi:hypothetical protein